MRLKSELWVMAYLRRAASAGVPGVVVARGDADAGVILIKIARLDGTADLYGPAPAGYSADDGERRWVCLAAVADEGLIEDRLESERRLDSDCWVVELEARDGRHFLEDWLAEA